MKANNLRITAQSTNREKDMADQDHVTHTTGVQWGAGQQTVILCLVTISGISLIQSSYTLHKSLMHTILAWTLFLCISAQNIF